MVKPPLKSHKQSLKAAILGGARVLFEDFVHLVVGQNYFHFTHVGRLSRS